MLLDDEPGFLDVITEAVSCALSLYFYIRRWGEVKMTHHSDRNPAFTKKSLQNV